MQPTAFGATDSDYDEEQIARATVQLTSNVSIKRLIKSIPREHKYGNYEGTNPLRLFKCHLNPLNRGDKLRFMKNTFATGIIFDIDK
jgi:hypothetical protein